VQTRIKPLYERIPPVKLFLDDVERIAELMGEVSSRVELETEDYVLKEPSQLADLSCSSIHHLVINGREPYVSLSLEPNSAWLYAESDTASSRGVFEKVKTALLARRRRLSRLTLNYSAVGMSIGFAFCGLASGIITRQWPLLLLGFVLACVAGPWRWWSYGLGFRRYSTIVLRRRGDQESFWGRNADTLVVATISAAVGTVFGAAATYFVQALLERGQ
jgi:hypothetical protein